MVPTPTIAKPGVRFRPNHDVTVDLQIKSLLGSGGMGEVYLARQRQWDVDVALKIPNDDILADPENRHRIVREAEAWTDLGLHPNIAYCYYAQPLGELLLLVIEYADGGNLRQWISDGRCADLKTGLDLAIQFCHGLEHAHKKLVHRDIKPENILLMQDGTLKITDFGIVRKSLADPDVLESTGAVRQVAAGMTTAGIGTADYMAPEQWADQSGLDARADIFAFGVCLYEMLCGARPYPITAGPRQEAPDPGRMRGGKGLPKRLSHLMSRCVDWDRDRRPSSAKEVRTELCSVYEEQFGEPCRYAELPQLTTQADDWNNRALSYLALGRVEAAEKAWQTALEADPRHPESIYNYGLHRWRGAKATDQQLLFSLRGVAESNPSAWLPRYLLAQIHFERGDTEGARQELSLIQEDDAARAEVVAAQRDLEALPSPSGLVRAIVRGVEVRVVGALSADGRLALAVGEGNELRLWETESGRCLRTFEGHSEYVRSVCLSADGRFALSGSVDNTVKLWELASGHCVRTFEGHSESVWSVCLSADGRFALSGSGDGTLKLWEVENGRCLHTFEGHEWTVKSVCLSADGRFALSGSYDKTLKLWEVPTGRCLRTFEGHSRMVNSVCLSSDGRFALSGSDDKTLKLWKVATGRCLRTFEGHELWPLCVCLSVDGKLALSGTSDGALHLWEVNSGRCLRTFEDHDSRTVSSTCFSGDGLSAVSWDGIGKLWRIGTFQHRAGFRLARLSTSAESLAAGARYATAISDAARASAIGDAVQECRALQRARGELPYRRATSVVKEWAKLYLRLRRRVLVDCWLHWRFEHKRSICLTKDGRFGLSSDGTAIGLWDLETGTFLRSFDRSTDYVGSLCLTADGRLVVSDGGGTLTVWDVATGRCLRRLEAHFELGINIVSLSADGRYALDKKIALGYKFLRFWDLANGRCLRTFEGHTDSPIFDNICLSPDGRYALVGGDDDSLRLWDMASGHCVRTFGGHSNSVRCVCMSEDGRFALSGSADATMRLWEVESGRCLRTFEGHTSSVYSVCISPDGRRALSGSDDNTAKLWDITSGLCLRTLKHTSAVMFVALSSDCRYAFTQCFTGEALTAWFLDWELEENEPADWDEGARAYLEVFLRDHRPYAARLPKDRQPTDEEMTLAFTRVGKPTWTNEDWLGLLKTLQCVGYGWLRPEGVGRELAVMAAVWRD